MRKVKEMRWGKKLMTCAAAMLFALTLGLCMDQFLIVSHAQSQGKVTASSANIRKEANASSAAVGSALKDAVVTINHQTTAADGTVWYQVFVDADTLGYIRSDLVQITDGTTPPTQVASTTNTTTTPTTPETPATVEAVNPVSASVTGGQQVRVRGNASTTSQIVTTVQNGMAITVTGKANGTDGKVWYQVNFINNGTEVTGFIRSDYVSLSGELTPPTTEAPSMDNPSDTEPSEPIVSTKDYETSFENDKWYLINNVEGVKYAIDDMFSVANQNQELYTEWEKEHKKVKSQKTAIILLVILMVAMAGAIAFLVFKIKDMMDSAYFNEVERETLRRRNDARTQGGNQRVMHTVGAEKQTGARPRPAQGAKPTGAPNAQGTRPVGQARPTGERPAGAAQGTRPTGQTRPAGERPAGATQGTRPTGQTRPAGERPAGAAQGARPTGQTRPAGERPVGATPEGARPTQERSEGAASQGARPDNGAAQQAKGGQNPGWKSKNFMQDDDEFEFEFLHWDGEDDN